MDSSDLHKVLEAGLLIAGFVAATQQPTAVDQFLSVYAGVVAAGAVRIFVNLGHSEDQSRLERALDIVANGPDPVDGMALWAFGMVVWWKMAVMNISLVAVVVTAFMLFATVPIPIAAGLTVLVSLFAGELLVKHNPKYTVEKNW